MWFSYHDRKTANKGISKDGLSKSKFIDIFISDNRFADAANLLEEESQLSDTVKEVLEEFVCKLYGVKEETDINICRYEIFSKVKKIPDLQKLSPTNDALYFHFYRANYQCLECKNALNPDHVMEDPAGKGWIIENDYLAIHWTTKKPAQDSILEFVSCHCKKSNCQTRVCRCYSVKLECTDLCGCENCGNLSVGPG